MSVEVRWAKLASPWGALTVVEGPNGVLRVDLLGRDDWRKDLARAFDEPIRATQRSRLPAARQLAEYFRGRRRRFDLDVDLRLASSFGRRVLERLYSDVPFGRTVSYGELASRVGRPGAARAVGGAMGKNPIPIIVPCHRVLAARGAIGGYTGGLQIKRQLLELEGIEAGS